MKVIKEGMGKEYWLERIQANQRKNGKDASREKAEEILADRKVVLPAQKIEVHYGDGRVEEVTDLRMSFVDEPKAKPARKRVLPADSDHSSGLTVALDAKLPIGHRSRLVWLYLLRHAGKDPRRQLRLTYGQIGEVIELSRGQVQGAMRRLVELGLVVVREKGRRAFRGQPAQVPLYYVPFPTSRRIDAWQAKVAESS